MARRKVPARVVVLVAAMSLVCAVSACEGPPGSVEDPLLPVPELPHNEPVLSGAAVVSSVVPDPTLCGDGIVGAGETCDLAIPEAMDGGCPTRCLEVDGCAIEALVHDACNVRCAFDPEQICVDDDGCCVEGCNGNMDADCPSICGNGVVEPEENCEPNGPDDPLCAQNCRRMRGVFRIGKTSLADPHLWIGMSMGGGRASGFCKDMAEMDMDGMMGGMGGGMGGMGGMDGMGGMMGGMGSMGAMDGMGGKDEDGDGFLDHSSVLAVEPWIAGGPIEASMIGYVQADCAIITEDEPPECFVHAENTMGFEPMPIVTIEDVSHGPCLEILEDSTSGYEPPPSVPTPPCFVSEETVGSMDMGGMTITLKHIHLAGTWVGDPIDGVANIMIRGFLTEEDAESNLLPEDYQMVGGKPMSSLFAGGKDNCATQDDRDVGPDGETVGWWLYLNMEATLVQELMTLDLPDH